MRRGALTATLAALAMGAAACGGTGGGASTAKRTADPADVTGDITVLTQRTDLQEDGTLAKYAAESTEIY